LKKNIEIKNKNIMKNLILFICVFMTMSLSAQEKIVEIPENELEEFFLAIDTLKAQDSLKTILIKDLELQVENFTLLSKQDSLILDFKNQEIFLLNEQIKLYDNRLNQVDKWYKKPWVGVVGGVLGTLVTIHVIDYSLPR
jgi:Ca2+/Na+ antiporter|tara:strand:- start:740 stop:1159 length:420 start_codon:yes stop_codon:yes gene_type:complete